MRTSRLRWVATALALLVAMSGPGVARSQIGLTGSWTRVVGSEGWSVDAVAATADTVLAASFWDGLLRIDHDGADRVLAAPVAVLSVQDVAPDVLQPPSILAGTRTEGLFRSHDGGRTWTHAASPAAVDIYAIAGNVLGTSAGVFVGEQAASAGIGSGPVRALLTRGHRLFAGTDRGVFVSDDAAATWRFAGAGIASGQVTALGATSVLGLGVDQALLAAGRDAVYRSLDGGATWLRTTLREPASSLLTVRGIPGLVLAGTRSGVWLSLDGGGAWVPVSAGLQGDALEVLSLAHDGACPATVYAGTADGVWQATLPCAG